jgi:methylaspartate mutase sigma subunit
VSSDCLGLPDPLAPPSPGGGRTVIVSSVSSDAHTWNLVFLQLLIEELGFAVVNLGACVPDGLLVSECLSVRPALLVISSVNGHGYQDALRVIERLRAHRELADIPMVVGGKLGTAGRQTGAQVGRLLAAGFDAVFDDRADEPASFRRFVEGAAQEGRPRVQARSPRQHGSVPDSAHELR